MDLMGKYNPNSLLYVQSNPPLENLVKTITFIVRSIPCLIDPEDLPLNEEMDNATLTEMLMSDRGASK